MSVPLANCLLKAVTESGNQLQMYTEVKALLDKKKEKKKRNVHTYFDEIMK